ncbi:MAG: hypothetical protein C5B59_09380 [Bacteroidetes bacterium]|nr:MAG: hypothetical protein C5B59_09380 [Bacteroidota bacterium]
MKKFIILYAAPIEAVRQMAAVPKEEQAKGMELWMQWSKKAEKHLVDLGSPLGNGKSLNPKGALSESDKDICGYSMMEANDMSEAINLLQGHPHLGGWNADCSIEVYEVLPIPGM